MITKIKGIKPIIHLCIFSGIILVSSCKTYYGDGLAGGIYTHMQTPMTEGEESVSRHYIGGKYNQDVNYYEDEKNESAEFSYHYAVSEEHVTYAIGAFGFLGNYQVKNLPRKFEELNGDHSYYGGGIRAKVAYNIPLNNKVHWRVIGLQSSWHIERGNYSSFKNKLRRLENIENGDAINSGINASHDFSNISFYPYTEFAIRLNDSWQLTPQFGFGLRLNELIALRGFAGLNISYKGLHIWGTVQDVGMSLDRVLLSDFSERQMGSNSHFQLGMAFSF